MNNIRYFYSLPQDEQKLYQQGYDYGLKMGIYIIMIPEAQTDAINRHVATHEEELIQIIASTVITSEMTKADLDKPRTNDVREFYRVYAAGFAAGWQEAKRRIRALSERSAFNIMLGDIKIDL